MKVKRSKRGGWLAVSDDLPVAAFGGTPERATAALREQMRVELRTGHTVDDAISLAEDLCRVYLSGDAFDQVAARFEDIRAEVLASRDVTVSSDD